MTVFKAFLKGFGTSLGVFALIFALALGAVMAAGTAHGAPLISVVTEDDLDARGRLWAACNERFPAPNESITDCGLMAKEWKPVLYSAVCGHTKAMQRRYETAYGLSEIALNDYAWARSFDLLFCAADIL